MSKNEFVVLVDEHDNELGVLDKLAAHRIGALHRAFSVFVFNSKGELLLQQRADDKYHSGGLWSNTCCSHPAKGEAIADAARRRLKEEMGFECEVFFKFIFSYRIEFENGLTEHELDHVYFGICDETPTPNSSEVKNWRYISLPKLQEELAQSPEKFTGWIRICLPEVLKKINHGNNL
ncbi:MAG: isopentenyl-diphosphate Delta-isomerase [Cytophagaceae bacterium]|nr:isopentenyl-diphosphate Delta-isomerase [Cytophagaceae bacterium]